MHALDCNIENLVNKYGDTVYRLAFSYMKSKQDAEDVSQDVFIKLFEYNGKFENEKLIFMLSFSVVSLAVNDVFHGLHGLRFIVIHKFPVAHNPFPVHHAEADVFAVGGVNESGIFVIYGNHVAGIGMDNDQIGSFPDLKGTREVLNAECLCPVDGGHA